MSANNISIVRVRDVLMVTMPPDPDDATISDLQEHVLKAMERYNAKGLALDISAVDTVDSFFARTVVETAKMVKLMGGQTVVAGMRPPVAITATQLGLRLGGMLTALDMNRALAMLEGSSKGRNGK